MASPFFAYESMFLKLAKQNIHIFWLLKKNNHLIKHVQTMHFGETLSEGAFLISCFFVFMFLWFISSLFIVLLKVR